MTEPITSFTGPYRFLSNFWGTEVTLDGQYFDSVENAYQAAKTQDLRTRASFQHLHPATAKRLGSHLPLRPDWNDVQLPIMAALLRQKFAHATLGTLLLQTGDVKLIEGNTWGDTFWGTSNGVGENYLGRLLMKIRKEVRVARATEVGET